ncbi:metal-dependent phosphohydrolase [Actinopolymorpha sp. B17G11]|uniref:HD domain-containing protein n=1 Tax=unclassified Actinopolymorpha TaxID=2627063 RepID=UPI0032D9A9EC
MSEHDPTAEALLARWTVLVPDAPEVGRGLVGRYAEPHRRYHDLRHLAEVLDRIDRLAAYAHDADAVRLAAWFHDAIYDPHRADNEEQSARLAEDLLPVGGVPSSRVAAAARLVRLTASHDPGAGDADGAVLSDADLGVLAESPERYAEYVADVRAEYAHVDDEAFRRGRAEVLERLLAYDELFHTPFGRTTWEVRARHNLRAELLLLRS